MIKSEYIIFIDFISKEKKENEKKNLFCQLLDERIKQIFSCEKKLNDFFIRI